MKKPRIVKDTNIYLCYRIVNAGTQLHRLLVARGNTMREAWEGYKEVERNNYAPIPISLESLKGEKDTAPNSACNPA